MIDGIDIKGITCDSRKVKKDYVFVAIKGFSEDGNDYINNAIEKGAKIIYTERDITNKKIPIYKVNNARVKLAELLNEFYDYPSEKVRLIGVTGTNGKTTTTHLINEIFKKSDYKTGLIGTLGTKIDDDYISTFLTTPDPENLFFLLDKMVKEKVDVVVMEVSSHGLKFYRTYGLQFDVAIHTNIDRDHMDLHGTMEDYINSKKRLFNSLRSNKLAVLNIDDDNSKNMIDGNDRIFIISYGLNNRATVTASSIEIIDKIRFILCLRRGITTINGVDIEPFEFSVKLNILGKHNIYNALAAISVALYFGIDSKTIKKALGKFNGIRRRLEKIYDDKFLVIDDYSHNPLGYQVVFETLQNIEYNDIILINAIRGGRGKEINRKNVEEILVWHKILGIKNIILSTSDDVVEGKDKVREDEIKGAINVFAKTKTGYELYDSLEKGIGRSLDLVSRGDVILLLGSQGMDKGKEIFFKLLDGKKVSS